MIKTKVCLIRLMNGFKVVKRQRLGHEESGLLTNGAKNEAADKEKELCFLLHVTKFESKALTSSRKVQRSTFVDTQVGVHLEKNRQLSATRLATSLFASVTGICEPSRVEIDGIT